MNAVDIQVRAVAQADSGSGGSVVYALPQFISDSAVRDWYILGCFALMILPMIVLAVWYHANIAKTDGGRRLRQSQNRTENNAPIPEV